MNALTKKASTVAILAAITAPGLAMADATVYGKAHLSFGSVSEDDGTNDNSSIAITNHKSRVGIKGDIDTDGTLKVVYKLEWEIDMDDNAKSSDDHIKSRNQYVGLKDSWGEVRIGRDDSPYKTAAKKKIEFLGDTWADYNNIIDKGQDTRNDNSISYRVKMGPGKLGIMYAAGDDTPAAENAGAGTSIGYDAEFGNFGFALATQTIEITPTNDETGTKLVLAYKMGGTQFGLAYETVEDDGTLDDTNTFLAVKHKMSDKDSIKFAYGTKDQGLADDATMTALAYNHSLNKAVSLYGLWVSGADNGMLDESKLTGDGSALVAGVIAKF
ncbi:MAG: porin [Gammaproteobacteria bacterium]